MFAHLRGLRCRFAICFLGTGLLLLSGTVSKADEGGSEYVAIAIPLAASANTRVIGTYDNSDDAYSAGMAWIEAHDGDMFKIERVQGNGPAPSRDNQPKNDAVDVKQRIKNVRGAIEDAKRYSEGKPPHELRRPGDTLREYGKLLASAWKQVTELKKTLVAGVRGLTSDIMTEANKVIAEFNREATNYNRFARRAGYSSVETVQPLATTIPSFQSGKYVDIAPKRPTLGSKPAKPSAPPTKLEGKTFEGTIGKIKATIEFKDDTFSVTSGLQGSGTWRQKDAAVSMETETSIYRGLIDGDQIKGFRYFNDHQPYEDWGGAIQSKPADGQAAITGVWRVSSPVQPGTPWRWRYVFNEDGTGTWDDLVVEGEPYKLLWKLNGNKLFTSQVSDNSAFGAKWFFQGTVEGTGIITNPAHPNRVVWRRE